MQGQALETRALEIQNQAGRAAVGLGASAQELVAGVNPLRVGVQHQLLTATAALVWSSDLPRPLQQILFDTADGITPSHPARYDEQEPAAIRLLRRAAVLDQVRNALLDTSLVKGHAAAVRTAQTALGSCATSLLPRCRRL